MSWQSWVDNLLAYEPVNHAAIYGLDGSVWAKSANCTASDAEVHALLQGLNAPSAASFSSFTFQGVKFITLRAGEGEVDGKAQTQAFSASKSAQCVVVAACLDPQPAGAKAASEKVKVAAARVRDALAKSGY